MLSIISLVCHAHVEIASTCLKTLRTCLAEKHELIVFNDGSLTPADEEILNQNLHPMSVVGKEERTARLEPLLQKFQHIRKLRDANPLINKLFDVPLLAPTDYLFVDSDILFYKKFSLSRVMDAAQTSYVFTKDIRQGYSAGLPCLVYKNKLELLSKINTGIFSVPKVLHDLDFVNWFLSKPEFTVFPNMLEQTCYASLPRNNPSWQINDTQVVCCSRKTNAISPYVVGLHLCGSQKSRLTEFYQRESQTDEVKILSIEKAVPVSALHVFINGVRNRLLPPHLR